MAKNNYFDYVSADFIVYLCSKIIADAEIDPNDFCSIAGHVDSFFKNFGITDVILYRSAGKSDSFSNICQSLFKSDCSDNSACSALDIRYHRGVEIEAENENALYTAVRKERQNADFIAVRSSDEKVIRAAADSSDVDMVVPVSYSSYSKKSPQNDASNLHASGGQINHIIAKIAKDKKTAFGFDIYPFLQTKGYRRSKIFADCMEMIPVLRKYRVPILLLSGANSFYDVRGPYEREAFGSLLGLSREEATAAVSKNPAGIIEMRKKQKSGKMILSGVEIVDESY